MLLLLDLLLQLLLLVVGLCGLVAFGQGVFVQGVFDVGEATSCSSGTFVSRRTEEKGARNVLQREFLHFDIRIVGGEFQILQPPWWQRGV